MKCTNCQHENPPAAKTCEACGSPLMPPTPEVPPLPSAGNRKKPWLWILLAALAVALAAGVFWLVTAWAPARQAALNLPDSLFSQTPSVFVRLKENSVTASAAPEEVYVFQDDTVTTWEDPDLTLTELLAMDSQEIRSRIPDACSSEVTGILTTDKTFDLYARGQVLVSLKNREVTETIGDDQLAGFAVEGTRDVFLTKAAGVSMEAPQTSVPVLTDPSQEKLSSYIRDHAQTACAPEPEDTRDHQSDADRETEDERASDDQPEEGDSQEADPEEESEDEALAEGYEPGRYKAGYIMKIRKGPSLDAAQVGRVEEDQVVEVTKVSRDKTDGSIWGQIGTERWICLKDAEYRYFQAQD